MPLFRSKRDISFARTIAREVIERVVGEKITYYPISKQYTNVNLYGEAKEKIFDPPVEMFALVDWNEQEIKTDQFGMDIVYNIEVYLQEDYIKDIELFPIEGDMIDYDDKKFEVLKIETPTQIFGKAGQQVGRKLTCRSIRESSFKVTISGTVEHAKRTAPDEVQDVQTLYDNVSFPYSGSRD